VGLAVSSPSTVTGFTTLLAVGLTVATVSSVTGFTTLLVVGLTVVVLDGIFASTLVGELSDDGVGVAITVTAVLEGVKSVVVVPASVEVVVKSVEMVVESVEKESVTSDEVIVVVV